MQNSTVESVLPEEVEFKRLGEAKVKALTDKALEWMNHQENFSKHKPQLCRIEFQIGKPVSTTEHLEHLYIFADKNNPDIAVRLWLKTDEKVATAGASQAIEKRFLSTDIGLGQLIAPATVLEIVAAKLPDKKIVSLTCFSDISANGRQFLTVWRLTTEDGSEYFMDAYTGKWDDYN
ncbi:MAG: hypothetical protein L3J82_06345 [Planctomycetes bacterium]|nr:hypothetical protein [Planctomycetota bacterium]